MLGFIHRLTCKHKEVHLLLPPKSLVKRRSEICWGETGIRLLRTVRLQQWVEQELKELSVPTPGLKDVTIG